MKKGVIGVIFMTLYWIGSAQTVGINTTGAVPATSAMLDVAATNKGVLIPRVDIADLSTAAPVASPVTSLLVYNTNGTTGEGYYYWDGTAWIQLIDASTTLDDHDWYEVGGTTQPDNINDDIYTQGNVGIGTVTPSVNLAVWDNTSPAIHLRRDATNEWYFTATPTGNDRLGIRAGGNADANERLTILTTGNVGIGTITPNAKLNVFTQIAGTGFTPSAQADEVSIENNSNAGLSIGTENNGNFYVGNSTTNNLGQLTYNTLDNSWRIATNTTEKVRVLSNGKVGVGLTSPRGRLEVNHDVSSEYSAVLFNTQDVAGNGLLIESNGGSDDDTLIYAIGDLNGTPTDKFILLGDGRVGVNQSNPNTETKLDVNGYHIGQVFSFSAYSTNTVNDYSNGSLAFTEIEDNHSNYNGTEYTAPIDGLYFFSTNVNFFGGDGNDDSQFIRFLQNNTTAVNPMLINPEYFSIAGVEMVISNTCLVRLSAGDTIEVEITGVDGGSPVSDYSRRSFMGYFVSK